MANPEWTEPWEWEDCAKCGATPVRDVLDDEALCQECCEAWARGENTMEHAAEMAARDERAAIISRERRI